MQPLTLHWHSVANAVWENYWRQRSIMLQLCCCMVISEFANAMNEQLEKSSWMCEQRARVCAM